MRRARKPLEWLIALAFVLSYLSPAFHILAAAEDLDHACACGMVHLPGECCCAPSGGGGARPGDGICLRALGCTPIPSAIDGLPQFAQDWVLPTDFISTRPAAVPARWALRDCLSDGLNPAPPDRPPRPASSL